MELNILDWIEKHEIKTESGIPLEFNDHRYMVEIYNDKSDWICSMKAAQITFTTYEILKSLHEAKNEKGPQGEAMDMIYVLPTAEDVKQFSGGKTNRIIDNNPCLQEWTKDKDSIEQKKVGNATIYYRGSWTERTALMISARKLIVDELDRCKQSIVEQYDSRLQHVKNPKKAFFSNPSLPEQGIHKYFQLSDQKMWHVKHSCGESFVLDESCINYREEIYQCPRCKGEIIDEERRMGFWKATSTGVWSGYWIPLWVNPMFSAQKIATYKREKTPEYFCNFVAGTPYLNTNDALSQRLLENNLVDRVNDQTGRIVIGVDTGHNIHYVVGNKLGLFYHGYINSVAENEASQTPIKNYDPYDELEKLLIRYPQSIMVSDQGGDLIGIRKLQAKYKGRVFLCWFTPETKTQQIIRWAEGEEYGKVLVDRNRAIQILIDEIKDRRFPIWGSRNDWQPYFNHWLNMYRVREIKGEETDPQYNWRWVWKRKGADHLALSTVYFRVGLDRFGQDLAQVVSTHDIFEGVPTADKPFRIPSQYRQVDI